MKIYSMFDCLLIFIRIFFDSYGKYKFITKLTLRYSIYIIDLTFSLLFFNY